MITYQLPSKLTRWLDLQTGFECSHEGYYLVSPSSIKNGEMSPAMYKEGPLGIVFGVNVATVMEVQVIRMYVIN